MKKNLTEMVFILDKSGSMAGLESDTIGGFNSMIARQKQESGDAYVSTVLFSYDSVVLHDRVDLKKIEPMTERDYRVGGSTALIDAIGGAIHHIGTVHKYARPEDVPEHTVFVIITDGLENSSRRYSADEVRQMIRLTGISTPNSSLEKAAAVWMEMRLTRLQHRGPPTCVNASRHRAESVWGMLHTGVFSG